MSELPEPPVRLCCFQRHYGAQCPDGKVMCCLCFGRFERDELQPVSDDPAKVWDICKECARHEIAMGASY